MSTFNPEQIFDVDDLERLGLLVEEDDFRWLHRLNVERLEEEGIIEALGGVLMRRYFNARKAAAENDIYSVDDTPYVYDGDPDRLVIRQGSVRGPSSYAINAQIVLKTEIEDEYGLPTDHRETVELARIDTALPTPMSGFSQEHANTIKEVCDGLEIARNFIVPHLNASLDGFTATRDIIIPRNIQLGED
jgi:hypothetical protein